jgi:DNA-binding FadR family transcriptional regulator
MSGLAPETMLPAEAEMAKRYGVGRVSLREALRILEVQGLIIMRAGAGGGPMVAGDDSRAFARMVSLNLHMSGATYRDVIEARLVVEPVMARLAASQADPETTVALEPYLEPLPESLEDGEYQRFSTGFHGLVSGLSNNPALNLFGRSLKDIYTDRIESSLFTGDDRTKIFHDHSEIARAIISGDAERSGQLMHEHMESFVEHSIRSHPGVLEEVIDWH